MIPITILHTLGWMAIIGLIIWEERCQRNYEAMLNFSHTEIVVAHSIVSINFDFNK